MKLSTIYEGNSNFVITSKNLTINSNQVKKTCVNRMFIESPIPLLINDYKDRFATFKSALYHYTPNEWHKVFDKFINDIDLSGIDNLFTQSILPTNIASIFTPFWTCSLSKIKCVWLGLRPFNKDQLISGFACIVFVE